MNKQIKNAQGILQQVMPNFIKGFSIETAKTNRQNFWCGIIWAMERYADQFRHPLPTHTEASALAEQFASEWYKPDKDPDEWLTRRNFYLTVYKNIADYVFKEERNDTEKKEFKLHVKLIKDGDRLPVIEIENDPDNESDMASALTEFLWGAKGNGLLIFNSGGVIGSKIENYTIRPENPKE
jgi:hypothetical protein